MVKAGSPLNRDRAWWRTLIWCVAAGAALVSSARFLQTLEEGYLIIAGVATLVTLASLVTLHFRSVRWPLITSIALVAFVGSTGIIRGLIAEVDNNWEQVSARMQSSGLQRMLSALDQSYREVSSRAKSALAAPEETGDAFDYIHGLAAQRPELATILYRGEQQVWSGSFRVEPDDLPDTPSGIAFTEFFVVLYSTASGSGSSHAKALTLLQALPPADHLSVSLEGFVARRTGTTGFSLLPANAREANAVPFVVEGDTLALVAAMPLVQGQVRLRLTQQLMAFGTVLFGVATILFLCVAWRKFPLFFARGATLLVVLGCVALIPFNQLSSATRLFDPSVYFSTLGGPLTANAGTMLISSALALLALLAFLRSRTTLQSKSVAFWLVIAIAVLGPFLLRKIASGIAPPVWGSSTELWLSLQAGLFMTACVVLLAGVSAGRALLGPKRGVPIALALTLAVLAAVLGPIIIEPPGHFPEWYPVLWIIAVAALALSRPARGFYLAVASVAALGAATLVWSASIRQRVALAVQEITAAGVIDLNASQLLERFGRALAASPSPRDRAALLRQYVNSDLASAQYPVELFSWDPNNKTAAQLSLARIAPYPQSLIVYVDRARSSGIVVQQEVTFLPGAQMLIAAPHSDGWVTTALVGPRSGVRDEPFLSLFGLTQDPPGEPPYTWTPSTPEARGDSITRLPRWEREGNKLHGDMLLGARHAVRAHVEVDLRGYDVLFQRGTLVLFLDLLIFSILWSLAVAADGSLMRWIRSQRHILAQSYRVLLTMALFAFFVIPAILFAIWSHRSILAGDRQARELLLIEMLGSAADEVEIGAMVAASERYDAPLFLYHEGRLDVTSDSLFMELAPLGRRLPPDVYDRLELHDELTTSHLQRVGRAQALVGYRVIQSPHFGQAVLAAPARADHIAIDRRRRDLGVLVLFSTAVGALAALVLSGIAARQLARPIGILRGAALAIARGERSPALPAEPRSEFSAVFAAFRTMSNDLNASRGELLAAQRRTDAILRNVASGVIAFDSNARVTLANPRSRTLVGMRLEPGMSMSENARLPALHRYVVEFLSGTDDEMEFDQEIGGKQMHGWLTRLSSGDGGAVLTLDDVSEMARAQRVIAWGQMARQVAHEIKNPLTPIRLGVQHLRRAHIDKREDFDRILDSNVARILEEIDRLDEIARAFSRYGVAPSQRVAALPVDVGDIARDVVALERMGEGEVEWRYDESEGSLLALAAEDELREVLLNLLENARHANARVVHMQVNRNATTLAVEVMDNGHGIPADVLPRIFEPHFSTRSSGSGLGLAISRKLIEGWGGQISVTSAPGEGTRVTILLQAPREL